MKRLIAVLSVLMISTVASVAVQDGRGTNVFGHVRIKQSYGINFGGVTRTNWPDTTALEAATNSLYLELQGATNLYQGVTGLVNNLIASTGAVNAATNLISALTAATNSLTVELKGATNLYQAVTGLVNNLIASTGAVNAATNLIGALSAATNSISAGLSGATNLYNTQTNFLNSAKLDKAYGLASELSVTGKFVRAMGATFTVSTPGDMLPVDNNFIKVQSDTGDKTAGLSNGVVAGHMVIYQGANETNTVTLTNNVGGVELVEGVDFTLKLDNTIQFLWNGTKWMELHRTSKQ